MSCPICKKTTEHTYRPFCSKRCADIDLGRWLTGGYAIPSEREEDAEEAEETRRQTEPNDPSSPNTSRH